MKLNRTWTVIAICLAGAWSVVAVVMWLTKDQVSSPDEVLDLMQNAPWHANPTHNDSLRLAYLEQIITNQNRLDFDQRRRLREDGEEVLKTFFDGLSEAEQRRYADGTVEPHLRRVVRILDSMKPEDRRAIAARLRRESGGRLSRAGGGDRSDDRPASAENGRPPEEDELDDMIGFGLEMQYHDASPARKLEMAQMLENMLAFLQGFRR